MYRYPGFLDGTVLVSFDQVGKWHVSKSENGLEKSGLAVATILGAITFSNNTKWW